MEELEQIQNLEVGTLKTFTAKAPKLVADLLMEMKLNGKFFAILIDGKKAELTDSIKEGQSIILLPKIAGG